MNVAAYVDASYGKSHTGCVITLGAAGPVHVRSSKQKLVTKSSTEAEVVGLSDCAGQAIHVRNFVLSQGYEVGPAIIYEDNLGCMALMKRGAPGSDRTRHMSIRHFWLTERVADGEVTIQHLTTKDMPANLLTKPVQGSQFVHERDMVMNWKVSAVCAV